MSVQTLAILLNVIFLLALAAVLILPWILPHVRQLEAALTREREGHVKRLASVNAERAREREDRRAAEKRASDTEKMLHERESEFFYKLSALARLPASAAEIAAVHRARNQDKQGENTSMGVHTLSQIRRKQEEESLQLAMADRESGKGQDEKMAEEAALFGGNGQAQTR